MGGVGWRRGGWEILQKWRISMSEKEGGRQLQGVEEEKKVGGFQDLRVYSATLDASIRILTEVVPSLPKHEKDDLGDQMRRASKAVPRLIAEGHAKRHQRRGFRKYLDDAHGESNEMFVCLQHCILAYPKHVDVALCKELAFVYDMASRQIFRLRESWEKYHESK